MSVFSNYCAVSPSPKEAEVESGSDDVVLMECEAVHGYEGQYEDELTFQAGDKVDVIVESKSLNSWFIV